LRLYAATPFFCFSLAIDVDITLLRQLHTMPRQRYHLSAMFAILRHARTRAAQRGVMMPPCTAAAYATDSAADFFARHIAIFATMSPPLMLPAGCRRCHYAAAMLASLMP